LALEVTLANADNPVMRSVKNNIIIPFISMFYENYRIKHHRP